jgi:putative Holliday junction resolvase
LAMPNVFLGFDFGMKRIGVAIGQKITRSANPLITLAAKDGIPNWDEIQSLIDEWHVDGLVVGIPYNMDGTEQLVSFAARKFANRLTAKFGLPVFLMDERLTTIEAKRIIHEDKIPREKLDQYAAKIILENYLNKE